jgi:hypothetical protein
MHLGCRIFNIPTFKSSSPERLATGTVRHLPNIDPVRDNLPAPPGTD